MSRWYVAILVAAGMGLDGCSALDSGAKRKASPSREAVSTAAVASAHAVDRPTDIAGGDASPREGVTPQVVLTAASGQPLIVPATETRPVGDHHGGLRTLELAASAAPLSDHSSRSLSRQEEVAPGLPQPDLPSPGNGEEPGDTYPIDLANALRLAGAQNPLIGLAREQTRRAWAEADAAAVLWLPSLRAGVSWNKHEGTIQQTPGQILDLSRGSLYAGAGARAVGTGSPAVPGLIAEFHLADAIFEKIAAERFAYSRQAATAVATQETLLGVSLAYVELLRAAQDLAIARETYDHADELATLTRQFAVAGAGLEADADRAATELAIRRGEVQRARGAVRIASARLAQLLRLDPTVLLVPLEPRVVPLEMLPTESDPAGLVAEALGQRPELSQYRWLISSAVARLRREKYAYLLPSVLMRASYGAFGGGPADTIGRVDDRYDLDVGLFWELRNFGFGDWAAEDRARSDVRQASIRLSAVMDNVAREVVEAHAAMQAANEQLMAVREGIAAAVLSYQRNLNRIRGGEGLPLEVLQSIQALALAQRSYMQAVVDFNSAQFSLQRAMGWPIPAYVEPPEA